MSGAMNSIMRTAGAACGAQLAAAMLSARTPGGAGLPLEDVVTIAFAIGAAGLVAAPAFALLVERPRPRLASRVPAISTAPRAAREPAPRHRRPLDAVTQAPRAAVRAGFR